MTYTVPQCEPTELGAGNSWEWDRIDADFPPSGGWSLVYRFNGASAFAVSAATSADGDYYEVRETGAETAARTAGSYRLLGYVSSGADRHLVYDGRVEVLPDFALVAAQTTHAERMLALCESVLEGRADPDVAEYQIAGRMVKKEDLATWRALRTQYALEVARLHNPHASPVTYIQAVFR